MSGLRQYKTAATFFTVHRPYDQEKLSGTDFSLRTFTDIGPLVCRTTTSLAIAITVALSPAGAQNFPADVSRGKVIYERHCLACHGTGGWGDGPDAAALKVPPANFHRFHSILKSDEELLRTIEHGIVFSPMHAWQGQLTETETQDVLAYIRLLQQQGR